MHSFFLFIGYDVFARIFRKSSDYTGCSGSGGEGPSTTTSCRSSIVSGVTASCSTMTDTPTPNDTTDPTSLPSNHLTYDFLRSFIDSKMLEIDRIFKEAMEGEGCCLC